MLEWELVGGVVSSSKINFRIHWLRVGSNGQVNLVNFTDQFQDKFKAKPAYRGHVIQGFLHHF